MLKTFVAAALAGLAAAAVPGDLVTSLPGWNGALPSKWYSGYLQATAGAHLHYTLITSLNNPATDPVVVWFNGGPGCSSLEGLFAEHGQLWVQDPPQTNPPSLIFNPYSWSNMSNVLYIESPAGVGFSYCDTARACRYNDTSSAEGNLAALQSFYASYPEYAKNPLFITGESYAGIYVPQLAKQVVLANKGGANIPLAGILVGNGCIGTEAGICGNGVETFTVDIPFLGGHALISPDQMAVINSECTNYNNPSAQCQQAVNQAYNKIGNVDVYNIYAPCETNQAYPEFASKIWRRPTTQRDLARAAVGGPDACIGGGTLAAYLNQASVKSALHVAPAIDWSVCSNNATFQYNPTEPDERTTTYPVILGAGVHVLIYNGDVDDCVPWLDNYDWTKSMNMSVINDWHPWSTAGQVSGYAVDYDASSYNANATFTFITVKGAGHMVPEYQPVFAFQMLTRALTNQKF